VCIDKHREDPHIKQLVGSTTEVEVPQDDAFGKGATRTPSLSAYPQGAGQVFTWLTKAFGGRDNAPGRVSHGKSATIAGLAEARQGFRPSSESQTT
jgi:hypothetical protein